MQRRVGRYEILRVLGRGGMAVVYLAHHTDLHRFVALKELGTLRASEPDFVRRFLQESRLAGSLTHPNIVVVYDYLEHGGLRTTRDAALGDPLPRAPTPVVSPATPPPPQNNPPPSCLGEDCGRGEP